MRLRPGAIVDNARDDTAVPFVVSDSRWQTQGVLACAWAPTVTDCRERSLENERLVMASFTVTIPEFFVMGIAYVALGFGIGISLMRRDHSEG